jgi:peptidoglycan hydrolase-like protein with peptidoglycan-binding domain
MEYMAYSHIFTAYEGLAGTDVINPPKLEFSWKKLLKSSTWLSLVGIGVFFAAVTQAYAASSAFITTNGSCLRVRTDPSVNSPVVACLANGTRITTTETVNGFAKLSADRYVASKWISQKPQGGSDDNTGSDVSGRVILKVGSRGAAVSKVQKALGDIQVDGKYGPETARRIREFQKSNNLIVDGVVGPETREALGIS